MKKKRQEPVFNIELDHHLRQIVMKRGHLIRGQRTRTVFATISRGPKSWLEARLIPNPGDEAISNWTKAHELASKINAELRTDVYVEPASKHGRFNAIGSGNLVEEGGPNDEFAPEAFSSGTAGPDFQAGVFGAPRGGHGFTSSPFGFGNSPGMPGPKGFNPMANIAPSLPPQVQQLMGGKTSAENGNLKCPALYGLTGWNDLRDNTQKMFEAEAAQLLYGGLKLEPGEALPAHDLTNLEMLKLQPSISRQLKRFLLNATSTT